jgi:hypothetical protein
LHHSEASNQGRAPYSPEHQIAGFAAPLGELRYRSELVAAAVYLIVGKEDRT